MKIKIIILFVSLPFFSIYAQQESLLSKYRQMALDYNYDVKAAEKNIQRSIEYEKSARADLKPKLSGGVNFQYTGNPMQIDVSMPGMNMPLSFQGKNLQYGASLSLVQPIYTGGLLLEAIKIANHQHSYALNESSRLRSWVCYQTDVQYWNTVTRKEVVSIASDFLSSMTDFTKTIRERVEVGLIDTQDLLMAEVKLNEAKYNLLQAQNEFTIGCMALNSILGVSLESETEIEAEVPVKILPDTIFRLSGENRPELLMAQDQINIAKSSKKINDAKYKPRFYAGIDGSYAAPGFDFKSDLDPNYAVYAKISIPIFEWGKRRNEKNAANSQIGIAYDNLSKVEDNVELEVHSARISLMQSVQQIELSGSSLQKAYDNEKLALERFQEGKVSVVDVIDAQLYRQTAQLNYTYAKMAAQVHYSNLIKAVNGYDYQ